MLTLSDQQRVKTWTESLAEWFHFWGDPFMLISRKLGMKWSWFLEVWLLDVCQSSPWQDARVLVSITTFLGECKISHKRDSVSGHVNPFPSKCARINTVLHQHSAIIIISGIRLPYRIDSGTLWHDNWGKRYSNGQVAVYCLGLLNLVFSWFHKWSTCSSIDDPWTSAVGGSQRLRQYHCFEKYCHRLRRMQFNNSQVFFQTKHQTNLSF